MIEQRDSQQHLSLEQRDCTTLVIPRSATPNNACHSEKRKRRGIWVLLFAWDYDKVMSKQRRDSARVARSQEYQLRL